MSDPTSLPPECPLAKLERLLQGLPETLPTSIPDSKLPPEIDGELAQEEGYWTALNSAFHRTFGYHGEAGFTLQQRGPDILSVIPMLQACIDMEPKSRDLVYTWVLRLEQAAISAGAVEQGHPAEPDLEPEVGFAPLSSMDKCSHHWIFRMLFLKTLSKGRLSVEASVRHPTPPTAA